MGKIGDLMEDLVASLYLAQLVDDWDLNICWLIGIDDLRLIYLSWLMFV
jgi:hypothetical protein